MKGGIGQYNVGPLDVGAIKLNGGSGDEVPFLSNDRTITTYGGGVKGEFPLGNFGNWGNSGNARSRCWTIRASFDYSKGDSSTQNEISVEDSYDKVPAVSFFKPLYDGSMDSYGITLGGFGLSGALKSNVERYEFAVNLGPVIEMGQNTFLRPNIGFHYERLQIEHQSYISTIDYADQINFDTYQKSTDKRVGGGVGFDLIYVEPVKHGLFAGVGGAVNFNHLSSNSWSTQMINIDLLPALDNQTIDQSFKESRFAIDWNVHAVIGMKLSDNLSVGLLGSYTGNDKTAVFRNRVFGDSDPNTFVDYRSTHGWDARLMLGISF